MAGHQEFGRMLKIKRANLNQLGRLRHIFSVFLEKVTSAYKKICEYVRPGFGIRSIHNACRCWRGAVAVG